MKRLIMAVVVVVALMGISEKAQAGPWTRSAFRLTRTHRYGYRSILGRPSYTRSAFRLGAPYRYGPGMTSRVSYRRYGRRDNSTFGKIMVSGEILSQILIKDRVLSMAEKRQAEELRMAREEQEFQHEQTRVQNNENQELQQRIRILELELEKLKLQ